MYQWRVMTFGLVDTGATCQRLADWIHAPLAWLRLLGYALLSWGLQVYCGHFQLMLKFGFRINRGKCNFCCTFLEYLGHVITVDGISENPQKAHLQIGWTSQPQATGLLLDNLLLVQAIHSRLCKVYKKVIALDLATRSGHCLPRTQTFHALPFTLRTDASSYVIGAVLLQRTGPRKGLLSRLPKQNDAPVPGLDVRSVAIDLPWRSAAETKDAQ